MLATAALVEIDWHTQALQGGREPKAMILAQRFLADAVCETVIAVGHRLINLIARVIRTDSNARNTMHDTQSATALNLGPLGRDYIPFVTTTSTAWLSLDVGRVRQLRRVAPQNSTGIATALDKLKELSKSPAWKAAFDHRGVNFHRWRLENEYVAGVDQNSSSMKDVVDYRDTVVGRSYGTRRQEYTAADGLTAQVATDARAGLEEVAHAADAVLDAILVALPEITNGYVLAIDNVKKKFSKTRRIP
ncbi:hypothetical protein ACFU44_10770 [Nocardia rhizosphaerihabitans]|uniref:hypothetical protein n=1 Tax=Nocardia rhizosphaerihabitans TaxID=1691570 RepID=UPI0036736078